jgi:hypothetical protein
MGGPRDDQLATDLVVNVMVLAELGHPLDTRSGQAGFCRPRLILKSGVEHTAVVATLVLRQCRFLLQHTNRIDACFEEGMGCRKPHDATANDCDVGHMCSISLSGR